MNFTIRVYDIIFNLIIKSCSRFHFTITTRKSVIRTRYHNQNRDTYLPILRGRGSSSNQTDRSPDFRNFVPVNRDANPLEAFARS